MEKLLATIFVFVIPGTLLVLYGIWLLKGGGKAFYMANHIFAGRVYAPIPWGIMFLVCAIATIPDSKPGFRGSNSGRHLSGE